MATQSTFRFLLSKPRLLRSFSSFSFPPTAASLKTTITPSPASSLSFIRRFRVPFWTPILRHDFPSTAFRSLSTRATRSSLSDPNPNYSNRPPKETILLDGCDFEHWLVVMEPPKEDTTRDDIIDSYIKTLAKVVGSEDEARMKIYSVSTRHYYAFGALVSEELSYKIKELEGVRWVLPDSYLDVKNKDYGGEPFINGQAVPYDPKYHEEWVRNNARANERNRRNDRPRNYDRSRNYERRRENMQQNRGMPPPNAAGMPSNMGGMPPPNAAGMPSNMGGMAPPNAAGMTPNMGGMPPPNAAGMPPNNMGGMPQNNVRMQQNMGNVPPNQGWTGNMPGNAQNFQSSPNPGNSPYQGTSPNQGWTGNMPGNSQNFQSSPNPGNSPYQGAPPNAQYQSNYPPPNAQYQDNYGPNVGGRNNSGGN